LFKVDVSFDKDFANNLDRFGIDIEKYIRWYLSQVYQDLAKQHSRKYTYVTPPGRNRSNIYLRSGQLRKDLSDARYVKQNNSQEWEAGFNIRPGSYLHIHAGERTDAPVLVKTLGNSSMFLGRMAIPLRAALNTNGTPKAITPRMMDNLLILPFHVLMAGKFDKGKKKGGKPLNSRKMLGEFKRGTTRVDFSGEDTKKFNPNSLIVMKKSGRKFIPLYVLAKEVKIPKRIFIGEKMDKYYDELWNKLNDAVEAGLRTL
jgi:hypothetical protein